ncbi:magnesium-dependent phosphatase 1 [Folsomia candida]|uniref:magnesium-dependent phosphatase 1 n=1 Tax=Folsomia candida TaxID=158441 RepID=UPI000B8F3D11|nr:magnesium-dependent phosphatase 1 [Folsomia candida]
MTFSPELGQLKLVVFDLDYTLWPYHVDSTVSLPFHVKSSQVLDQTGKEIKPFPEVPIVLDYLAERGVTIAAASRTTKPPGAHQLLDLFDWNRYFALKEIYPGCKTTHFKRFKDQTMVPYSSMLFFDDEDRNIHDVSNLGVKCVLVQHGMNMKLLHEALNLFKN